MHIRPTQPLIVRINPNPILKDATMTPLIPDPEQEPTIRLWPTAGKACGLGRSATYDAAERGEIPVIRLGGRLVVPTAALRKMLHLHETGTTEPAA